MSKHKEETAVAVREDMTPALAGQFSDDAGAGFDTLTTEDYGLPFLKVLQKMSPAVTRGESAYVEGAEAGMFLDTVSGEVAAEVEFIPCAYAYRLVEWRPKSAGGGIANTYTRDTAPIVNDHKDEKGQNVLDNGNVLVDTAYYYGLMLGDVPKQVVLALKGTQLKHARKWNGRMAGLKVQGANGLVTPPMYSSVYRLSTTLEKNDKGSWYGLQIERTGYVQDAALYQAAKHFSETALGAKLSREDAVAE